MRIKSCGLQLCQLVPRLKKLRAEGRRKFLIEARSRDWKLTFGITEDEPIEPEDGDLGGEE
jgi:hypothetical protein